MVAFEPSARGRAALRFAGELASQAGKGLIVGVFAPLERLDVGCARCRHGAAIWNVEMGKVAHEELAEAARLLDPEGLSVRYLTIRGDDVAAITGAAVEFGADLLVVPFQADRRLGIFPRRTLAQRLAGDGAVTVIAGPEARSIGD